MLYHVFRTKLLYTNLTDLTSLIISDQSYNPYISLPSLQPSSNPSDWNLTPFTNRQAQQKVSLDGQLQTLPQTEVIWQSGIFCWSFEAVGIPNMTFGGVIYTKCMPLFWFPLQNGWARALHFRMILGRGGGILRYFPISSGNLKQLTHSLVVTMLQLVVCHANIVSYVASFCATFRYGRYMFYKLSRDYGVKRNEFELT